MNDNEFSQTLLDLCTLNKLEESAEKLVETPEVIADKKSIQWKKKQKINKLIQGSDNK